MKKTKCAVLLIASFFASTSFAESKECEKNFTNTGSFFKGHTYKTTAFVAGVSQGDAVKKAAQDIVSDGWQITNSDQSLGVISAAQGVSFGQGKVAPLNIAIIEKGDGVSVSISYATSGGVKSPVKAIVAQFCKTVDAIGG